MVNLIYKHMEFLSMVIFLIEHLKCTLVYNVHTTYIEMLRENKPISKKSTFN